MISSFNTRSKRDGSRFISVNPLSLSMSTESVREPTRCEEDGDPRVPVEVLDAIDNLAEEDTASKDEIQSVLKF